MKQQPSGIRVGQMRVPLGVFGMIFESRPNVTIEAASLSIKSGNACILRGGSEAIDSNKALARLVQQALVGGPARRGGATGADHRPRGRGPPDRDARVRGRDHPARRQGPDRADLARSQGAGDQAPGRQLPHYVDDPCDIAMAVTVADNAKTQKYSLQCQRGPAGGARRGEGFLPKDRRDVRRQGRGDALRPGGQGDPAAVQARPEGRHEQDWSRNTWRPSSA